MKVFLSLLMLALASTALAVTQPTITPDLEKALQQAGPNELLNVFAVCKGTPDYEALGQATSYLPFEERRDAVVAELRKFTQERQSHLLSFLESQEKLGKAQRVRSLWINNVIAVKATKDVVLKLAQMPGIEYIRLDVKRHVLLDEGPGIGFPPVPSKEWNISLINAPAVWNLGFTGAGVVVGHFDTGVNYTHFDLADHIWINSDEIANNSVDDDGNGYVDDRYGYDFSGPDGDPRDDGGHGTHTAGTVASDGTAGDSCGVAPDAQIMGCKVLDGSGNGTEADVWEAIAYAVNNGARVMTFSIGWMHAWSPDRQAWRNSFNAALSAGLVAAVASGNERSGGDPAPDNVRTPGDVPPPWFHPGQTLHGGYSDVVTVGATTSSDNIAGFSSYGPVSWESISPWLDYPYNPEMGLKDPDVSAPGDNVTSCSYTSNNGYLSGWSGTSMATPHVAGLMALLISKNQSLTPAQVDSIIELTAVDKGAAGKDNDYGAGRIDCLAAINLVPTNDKPYVFKQSHQVDDWGGDMDGVLDPGETADLIVTLMNSGLDATNVDATLRESDPYVSLTDSFSTFGNIPSGTNKDNSANPYTIVVDPSACDGYSVPFTLHITADGGYTNDVSFSLTIGETPSNWQTHNVGNVRLTVTGFGALGFDGIDGNGDGFQYPKNVNHLYYGSMIAGNSSSYVVDRFYNDQSSADTDWETRLCQGLRFGQQVYSDQDGWVRYEDTGHPTPKELQITQDSWAWGTAPHNDYVIIRYTMFNGGNSTLSGMYLGQFADFDMGADPRTNYAGTDATRRLSYMYPSASGPYVGIRLLDPKTAANLSCIDHDLYVYSGMTEQNKIDFLDATLKQAASDRAYDWSVMVSAGPYDLAPGDTAIVAVVIVGGDNLADIQGNSDDAQAEYDGVGIHEGVSGPATARSLALYQNSPNPFSSATRIEFSTPGKGTGSLQIFDATGRVVRSFKAASAGSSRQSVLWDGTDDAGKRLANGVYFYELTWSGRSISKKMVIAR
jgi:subtilisin family serine protease